MSEALERYILSLILTCGLTCLWCELHFFLEQFLNNIFRMTGEVTVLGVDGFYFFIFLFFFLSLLPV